MNEEEEKKMYKWFFDNNVKSISPMTGKGLAMVRNSVWEYTKNVKDKEIRKLLLEYLDSLKVVMEFAIIHQRAVIDKLAHLLKRSEE